MKDYSHFCSAPWFSTRIDWDSKYKPCCRIDLSKSAFDGRKDYSIKDSTLDQWMSSEYSQYLRDQIGKENRLSECHRCWTDEKHNLISMRQSINLLIGRKSTDDVSNTWIPLFLKQTKSLEDYRLIQADVKLSNVCNYSCAMCNPHDSSKILDRWVQEKESTYIQKQINNNPSYFLEIKQNYQSKREHLHLIDILNQPLTHLKLLGGEPLLDKQMLKILKNQPMDKKSQINLNFITNGSQDLIKAAEFLKDYNTVNFAVSIESSGELGEYMRPGSNWEYICRNILTARKQGIKVSVHCVIQALNSLSMGKFLNWISDNEIPLSLDILQNPNYLSIKILPESLRRKAINNLEYFKELLIYDTNGRRIPVEEIQKIISEYQGEFELYDKFLEFVDWHEKPLAHDLKTLQPEFYNYKI
jgi:molybdenum cofactor biosynthesis enzyme MoaA